MVATVEDHLHDGVFDSCRPKEISVSLKTARKSNKTKDTATLLVRENGAARSLASAKPPAAAKQPTPSAKAKLTNSISNYLLLVHYLVPSKAVSSDHSDAIDVKSVISVADSHKTTQIKKKFKLSVDATECIPTFSESRCVCVSWQSFEVACGTFLWG